MTDVHNRMQRSRNMSAIKSRGNISTEMKVLKQLKENRLKGWLRHVKRIPGTPDFVFIREKVAVFIDGCFWHGCSKCRLKPATNVGFWRNKLKYNKERDKKINRILKEKGWKVIRIWEHMLRNNDQKAFLIINNVLRG